MPEAGAAIIKVDLFLPPTGEGVLLDWVGRVEEIAKDTSSFLQECSAELYAVVLSVP